MAAHFEAGSGETDGNLALGSSILDIDLKIVNEALGRGGAIGLDDADIVAVEVHVRVLNRELIGPDDGEPAGAVQRKSYESIKSDLNPKEMMIGSLGDAVKCAYRKSNGGFLRRRAKA
nr:hypothetical protein Iba_chr11aCG19200 [Ipomoea batatas]GMD59194.1 hypothetical protein Iba_chr11fCG12800 [Ipomoea batatas]GME09025.1 hypothetical protein Iba_scaffold8100CG0010 [Ipomoea batatas]